MALAASRLCALVVLLIRGGVCSVEDDEQECYVSLLQMGLGVEEGSQRMQIERVEAKEAAVQASNASRVVTAELGATFTDAEGCIWSVAFSPDGFRLASGSCDGKLRVYDLQVPYPVTSFDTLTDCPEEVGSVDYWQQEGGPLLLGAGCLDGRWRLYNATSTTEPPLLLQSHKEEGWEVDGVSFSTDAPLFAVGSAGGNVQVYSVEDPLAPKLVVDLPSGGLTVTTVGLAPDGRRLAVGYFDGTLKVFGTAAEGFALLGARNVGDAIINLGYSPDGRLLAVALADGTASVFAKDLTGGEFLRLVSTIKDTDEKLNAVAFSPDSTLLATGSWDMRTRIYDVSEPCTPRLLDTLGDATGHIYSVAWVQHRDHDQLILATGSSDGRARLYYMWD